VNPVVYRIGSLEIHAFTAWIGFGVAAGIAIAIGAAALRRERLFPWLDTSIGAVIGGVVGARAFHVWLNWEYFSAHTDQITMLNMGGLDWHGALFGGMIGLVIAARLRRVPLTPLIDSLALALPIGAAATWMACGAANCGYGLEVQTLADYPQWLVTESPDVYGITAPRLNLPPVGIILAIIVLAVIIVLVILRWLIGLRLWLALTLYALGMAVISFFRAEYVPIWFGRRADQILDLAVAFGAILIFAGVALLRRRSANDRLVRSVFL
jgi:phosphatidylglycerol---prolipoprotein diacylglyceryl transferase